SEKITVELPYAGNGKWLLTDISGKIIKQSNIENNTISFYINVNEVVNGTYLLSLEINDIVSSSKIVIVR
ncbi:MAG TPA: T9SS type A sorting domain-containing protein, partial [Chitinophagaceae bacterium]|nr:T9SS type A sorting domain-containing protein [Chitinophagaceae bacterium]